MKKMCQFWKNVIHLLQVNVKELVYLEIVYRMLGGSILVPTVVWTFRLIMNANGYQYLTMDNMVKFFLNPLTLILLIGLLLIITAAEIWHVGMIISILDHSAQDKKVSILTIAKYSIRREEWMKKKGRFHLVLFMLFMLPFLNLGTGIVSCIHIPEFILETIRSNTAWYLLLLTVYGIVLIWILRWMYSMCYIIIEGYDFRDSAKKSSCLSKGYKAYDVMIMLSTQFCLSVLFAICVFAGVVLIMMLYRINWVGTDILMSVIGIFLTILILFQYMLSVPVSLAIVTQLFYDKKTKKNEPIIHLQCQEKKKLSEGQIRRIKRIKHGLRIITLITGVLFIRGLHHGDYNLNVEYVRTMEVSAHRGASAYYPENTMAAFKGAVLQNADWIELDVQQSKDGEIFVMHDTNFERTTGVNKNSWEMTWEEISELDAGSFFSKEYEGEKIPLLRDVIEFAKIAGIRLNIELKPTGNETDFEKCVIDIINEEHFAENCVVTSMEYQVLENIKKIDPGIRTVYVMAVAVGEIEDLIYADDFSIEATFVTENLVKRMHEQGKQVYAWTIDTEENIRNMIEIGVDNIISNNVPLANNCIQESRTRNILIEMIERLKKESR